MRTAYVVRHPNSTRDIDRLIQEALAERGVRVSVGPIEQKPKDVDFYVEYVDRWQWGIVMYLDSLDIRFENNSDGTLIGSATFKEGMLDTMPNPRKIVSSLIAQIYTAK